MKTGLFLISFVLSEMAYSFPVSNGEIIQNPNCGNGSHIYEQPQGTFAVLINCEGALGKYLTVLYYKSMGAPTDGAWSLGNRFWQESDWNSGIVDFAWIGKNQLLISTSGLSGKKAGVYALSLKERKTEILHQPKSGDLEGDYFIQDYKDGILTVLEKEIDKKSVTHKLKFIPSK